MSTFDNKPLSLLERKKQQWAREKEELDQLYVPWGKKEFLRNHENDIGSSSNVENMLLTNNNAYLRKDCTSAYRRSSLPPLRKNQHNSSDRYEREMGGETSGYGSDNANTSPEYPQPPSWNQNGYESSSSRDDRPKWRHKKDSSEIFWEDKEICYENENSKSPPNWVKRGLQQDGEIVVTNTSPAESPEQDYTEQERPLTSSTISNNKTFIRGQNVRLDSAEMADRERKRQIALIHQEAIRQQLEERERKRTEERKRRILEEREEELRIERENQIEKQRQLHEQKLLQEKLERERKRKEAIQEAIEIAEKQAKIEKKKMRMMRQNINYNMDNDEIVINEAKSYDKVKFSNEINNNVIATVPTNLLSDENKKDICSDNCNEKIALPEIMPPRDEILNNNEENDFDLQSTFSSANTETFKEMVSDCKVETPLVPLVTPQSETRAVFIQPTETLQFAQYAVLIPSSIANSIPVAIPLVLSNETETPSARTENRILTPSQYRLKNRKVCDSSTQTEFNDYRVETETNREKYIREKLTNLDLNYEIRSRKERRSRSESIVEERPKWGANRPPTRYLKQSEKDPLYQRKKQRQKIRDNKYDDKNSSDDSQLGTPRWRKKGYVETRHTRPLWRKNDQIFARNIRLYQTEFVPLESDKDHIYYEHKCCCMCKCTKNDYADNVDILQIEQNSPRIGMSKMDDLFAKKKDTAPVLDLSKTTVRNKEDFRRLMEKVPDFKIKPERVPIESMKIREKKFKFKSTTSDVKAMKEPYAFMDPLPVEMNKLKINELANVTIDWKMLTSLRPKSKVEENYFGRIVELGKLEIKTRAQEKRQYLVDTQIRKTKNKSGIVETRILSCTECGEDFCNGKLCTKYTYDAFTRIPESVPTKASAKQVDLNAVDIQPRRRRIKRRSRSKSKAKKNGPVKKSKSPKKSGKRN